MTDLVPDEEGHVPEVVVTPEELKAERSKILDKWGVTLEDMRPKEDDCRCCPPERIGMSWADFESLRTIAFLLGESR